MPAPDHRDLSRALTRLTADIRRRVPELVHIHPETILFTLVRSRSPGSCGVQARIVPLRFAGGRRREDRLRSGYRETWQAPRLEHEGREVLYLIQIMVPRFFRLSCRDKLATVVHELFHVSPACDGDLRRFAGRNFAHGSSRREYQRQVETLVDRYLATAPEPDPVADIDIDEADWQSGRVRVTGLQVPRPRQRLVARRKSR